MSAGQDIWNDIQEIVDKSTDTFRVSMDANVHCMDVGIAALKASDPEIDYATKEKLHRLFRKEFFSFNSLEEAILHARDKDNIDRSGFVEDPELGDYIVGPSYKALQRRVSNVLKSSTLSTSFTGTDNSGKTVTNIGHLSLKQTEAATTPLEAKLRRMLAALNSTPIAASLVSSKLKQLHKYHNIGTSYTFNRKNFDLNKLEAALGTGTVLVTLQTSIKNSALATLEAKIERELAAYLRSEKFRKQLLKVHGSNTIPEDLVGAVRATLAGETNIPGSAHKPKAPKTTKNSLLNAKAVSASKPAKIKTVEAGTSLTSLQNLINTHLQDVVSANMGNGDSRNVLNYRTGRLASSAKVERMSQSREGMITAFYSYMKNPYATFSEGGQQQFPKSRDPKLLISKSIREIAAERVGNRLRATVV